MPSTRTAPRIRPALVFASDPVALPVRDPATGRALTVRVTYDAGACLDLDTVGRLEAWLPADLRGRDLANTRARRDLGRAWLAAYPTGDDRACGTEADRAAYDTAYATYAAARDRLTAEADELDRAIQLTLIAHLVIAVDGPDVDVAPAPDVPASWDAWPTPLLRWITAEGRGQAKASLTSPKS